MVGMMQISLGATVVAASPIYNDGTRIVQLDGRNHRQREHDERLHRENVRHEREMRRRHHESEREWHERQERENWRHDRELHDINAFLFGVVIGSQLN